MNKKFIKIVKNCYLLFVVSLITYSCSKETVSDEINKIDYSTTAISSKVEGEPDEAKLMIAKVQADESFNNLRKFQTKLTSTSGTPIYVGVIPNGGACPTGVPQIIYHEDLEDTNNATKWDHEGCFEGAQIVKTSAGDVNWYVCIVDANTYSFDNIKYGYAVLGLSFQQFFHGSDDVSVWIDDEDDVTNNYFDNSSYGFTRNSASPYYPTQAAFNNTFFWFSYFKAESNSVKLPHLDFSYSVFSNFSCCDWTNQNTLLLDVEDDSPTNLIVDYAENKDGVKKLSCKLDATYGIISSDKNVRLYLQNADIYSY